MHVSGGRRGARGEVAPGDVLHDNVEDAALDAGLMIADDIGVGETAQDLHLVARVGARAGVHPGELHLLHSHADVILATTREVHLAERPRADRLEKLVAVVEAVVEQARARGGRESGGDDASSIAARSQSRWSSAAARARLLHAHADNSEDASRSREGPWSIARAGPSTPKMGDVDPAHASRHDGSREGSGDGPGAPATLLRGRGTDTVPLSENFDQFLWDAATKTTPGFRVLISGDEEKRPGSARGSPQRSTRNHPGDDGVREFLFDSEFHTTSQSRKSVRIRGVLSSESRPLAGWRFFIRRESSRRSHVLLRVKASIWRLLLRPRPRAHRVVQE